jgi:phosphate uptake regulator
MHQITDKQELVARLAAVFRDVEQQLATAAHALGRGHPQLEVRAKEDVARELDGIDRDAVRLLRESDDEHDVANAVTALLRATADLRHVVRLTVDLSASILSIKAASPPDDLADRLHQITGFTLVQLAAARQALLARSSALALDAIEQDEELDSWYDLLLKESVEDAVDAGKVPPHLLSLLAAAKSLERISDHSHALAEDMAALFEPTLINGPA